MTELPDVSVVIPTRDRWHLLRFTLDSVLAQRGVSVEVVVVDDGSRDETASGMPQTADDRVRIRRTETSGGVAAARNLGIREARAAWVAFLDDDDLWSPEKLERQLAAAEAASSAFAYCAAVYADEALEVAELKPAPSPDDLLANVLRANSIPAGASNVIARAEVLRRLGGFDESLFQLADWDLWIRLAETARAAACHEPLVAYRMHGGNMVLRRETGVMDEIERLAAKHADLAARKGVEIDRVLYTRWIAWARRREGRRLAAAAMYLRGAIRYRNAGNVVRAAAALLGERAMALGGAGGRPAPPALQGDLAWLERYRRAEAQSAES